MEDKARLLLQGKSDVDKYAHRKEITLHFHNFSSDFAIKDLTIYVLSGIRFKAYRDQLIEISRVFGNKGWDKLSYTPKAFQDILQTAADILDALLIDYIHLDLENFRKEHPEKTELSDYYEQKKDLYTHLCEEFPHFEAQLKTIQKNYVKHILLMLVRVETHFNSLEKLYAKEPQICCVQRIKSSGSDFHQEGKQVVILELGHTNKEFIVVYKPSSMQADAMIVGNLEKLLIIDPNYVHKKSMMEIFNKIIPKDLKLSPILILPLYDGKEGKDTIAGHFGFSEFIGSSDWYNYPKEEIEKICLTYSNLTTKDIKKKCQTLINESYKEFIKAERNNPDSPYILRNDKQAKIYDKTCGVMAFFMFCVGACDSHQENLINQIFRAGHFMKIIPQLLDWEASLSNNDFNLEAILCLDPDGGSMRSTTSIVHTYFFLEDISGKREVSVRAFEKNKIFQQNENHLVPHSISQSHFMKGFSSALEICTYHKNRKKILHWFEDPYVKSMQLRFIPYRTLDLKRELDYYFEVHYDLNQISVHLKELTKSDKILIEKAVANYAQCSPIEKNFFLHRILPSPAILEYPKSLHRQYFSLSLPVYYVIADSTVLKDCKDRAIELNKDYCVIYGRKDENNNFFEISLLSERKNRLTLLLTDPVLQKTFIINIDNESKKLLEVKSRPLLIPHISLPELEGTLKKNS